MYYDEFHPNQGYPKMMDNINPVPYEGETEIIEYLLNGSQSNLATGGFAIDIFDGEMLRPRKRFLTDGEYLWCTTVASYIAKYHLRLPKEIESHILDKVRN